MKKTVSNKTLKMAQLAILSAIVLLMSFTPLGYLKTAGLEISFLAIPVTLGAILLGPSAGAFLGALFGITSFIQCFGMSPFGVALMGINPVYTFIVCFVPRLLMGWLTGLIFKAISKIDKTKILSYGVASVSGAILNTVLFMSALVLCFYQTDFIQGMAQTLGSTGVLTFVVGFVGVQGLVEAIVAVAVAFPASKILSKVLAKI